MAPTAFLQLILLVATVHATNSLLTCLTDSSVPFITPSSPNWPLLASPFNLRVAYIPAAIAIPKSTSQVAAAVACGAKHNVKVTPKAGGHSYASLSSGGEDGHLVIELDHLAGVSLDRKTNIAAVGPGARLGDVATGLYNQGKRAFSHGTCPGVGVGGHVLHGGYGMSSRTHGLALDWVESLTVVLANASVVDCSATVRPSLFFAMLGAGSGFGIATEFRFRTFEAPKVVTWFSAELPWDGDTAVEGLKELEIFTRYEMSSELNMRLMASANQSSLDGVFYGDRAGLDDALGPFLEKVNGSIATAGTTGWIGGLERFSESPTLLVVPKPYNIHDTFYAKSLTLTGLNGTSAENFVDYWLNVADNVDRKWFFQLDLHGGASSGVWAADNGVTSYPHRDKLYIIQFYDRVIEGSYPPNGFEFLDGWVDVTTQPLEWGEWGMYVNYVDARLGRREAEELYWGKYLPRLRQIKRAVDPGDLFFNPISIEPARR
ncbi:hypothetical protein V494_08089 [Pseudogymnoascus sp. VKM F-4513 (FW-928)]|nr:hypothetical protein V494_08089 [Pseudogymnoascus sp. VKM F-4513 (FW-928)]